VIAFDTNVLVRLLVKDDEEQTKRAAKALREAEDRGEKVFVGDIVLAELEWVLEAAYSVPRDRIHGALHLLATDDRFQFESRRRILSALDLYAKGRADLSDLLLTLTAAESGARRLLTFDRILAREENVSLL